MAIRTPVTQPGIYFITFTCFQWLPLLEIANGYELIYRWFNYLKHKNFSIIGYVLMPNHVHLILKYPACEKSLNTIIGNAKRLIAYDLVKRLQVYEKKFYIAQLKIAVEEKDKKRGKKHEVWENSFDVKQCKNVHFLLQKLNYLHNNPCSKHWTLCTKPENYFHSSAAFYLKNVTNEFVTHYKEFF